MKKRIQTGLSSLIILLFLIVPQSTFAIEHLSWFKQSFLDFSEDLTEANDENRKLMIIFYQRGCPYCDKLVNTNFSQKKLVEKVRGNFDTLAVDIFSQLDAVDFEGNDTNVHEFSKTFNIQATPTVIFFENDGTPVLRIDGYYPPENFEVALDYVIEGEYKTTEYVDYFAENIPPKTGRMQQVSYLTDAGKSGKVDSSGKEYITVFFEQSQCPECETLHKEIDENKKVSGMLKSTAGYQLNMWSKKTVTTPDGVKIPMKEWARQLGVTYAPTIIIFDKSGKELARNDAYLKGEHLAGLYDYVTSGKYTKYGSYSKYFIEKFYNRAMKVDG